MPDFNAWLANPNNDAYRNTLVQATSYYSAATVSHKWSKLWSPKNNAYLPIIAKAPIFMQLARQFLGEGYSASVGDIDIYNPDGRFDEWFEHSWGGRALDVYYGDVRWDFADYTKVRTCIIDELEVMGETLMRFNITDITKKFKQQIQLTTIDDGSNGDINVPLCYGRVYQIAPVAKDLTNHIYKMHDGPVEDTSVGEVFFNGDHNVMSYTENNSTGEIDLSGAPEGILTLEAKGAKPGGVYLEQPGEIFRHIINDKADVADPGEIDTSAFSSFDTSKPVIGLYIDSPGNIDELALDPIVYSFFGYYCVNREGKVKIGEVSDPSVGTSQLDIRRSKGEISGEITVRRASKARYQTELSYQRAWTTNNSENPYINLDDREHFRRGYKVSKYVDAASASIQTQYADAEAPEVEHTLIEQAAAASTQAQVKQALLNQPRYECEVPCNIAPFQIEIGDIVTIYDDFKDGRYGFKNGRKIFVIGLEEDTEDHRINITGWF